MFIESCNIFAIRRKRSYIQSVFRSFFISAPPPAPEVAKRSRAEQSRTEISNQRSSIMKSLRRVLIPAQKSSGSNAFYALTQLLCGGYLIASLALPAAIHCIDYESPTGIVSIGGWCCFAGLGAAGLGLCWWYYLRITLDFFRNHITFRNSRNIYIYFFFLSCLRFLSAA